MLQIDDKIISLDIFEKLFCCDLSACSGACCVIGDSGAPLEEGEHNEIAQNIEAIKEYMTPEGLMAIDNGLTEIDNDDDVVTPLIGDKGRCAYSYFDKGICFCAMEKAFIEGKSTFRKPISCYLYPIRLSKIGDNIALNYDKWDICAPARELGEIKGIPVFQFLKDPIICKFGAEFYSALEGAYQAIK